MGNDKNSTYADATKEKKKTSYHHQFWSANNKFKGKSEEIKHDTFGYGKSRGNQCIKSREAYIGFLGKKYGASEQ